MLQTMLTFLTKPEYFNDAAMKTRSGGKACYAFSILCFNKSKDIFDTSVFWNTFLP